MFHNPKCNSTGRPIIQHRVRASAGNANKGHCSEQRKQGHGLSREKVRAGRVSLQEVCGNARFMDMGGKCAFCNLVPYQIQGYIMCGKIIKCLR